MKTKMQSPLPIIFIISLSLVLVAMVSQSGSGRVNAEISTILSTYPNWFYNGNISGENMGSAVSGVGDVNGDGKADVLVGAQKFTLSQYREGAAFLFFSTGGGLSAFPDWTMGGGQQGSMYGCALSGLGDVDGDGFDDIVVGACEHNDPLDSKLTKSGAAFVYYGANNFAAKTVADWHYFGDQVDERLGSAVNTAGDINQDGFADLILGAPYSNKLDEPTLTKNGKVLVFFGSKDGLSADPDWSAVGDVNGAMLGSSVASAGDTEKDGYADIIVGAPRPTNVGYAHVFSNVSGVLESDPSWSVTNERSGSWFGSAVAGVGDVNKDGYADVLVGAPYEKELIDEIYQPVGCVYLYLGSPDGLVTTPSWRKCSNQPGGMFGASVAAAGDMNGDGYADFLVGMPFYSISNEKQGAVFLFFGSSGSIGVKGDYFESTYGNKADTEFGTSVSSAGDVNNDGLLDVIVGAPNYKASGSRVGRAMTYYAGIPGIPDVEIFTVFLPNILK